MKTISALFLITLLFIAAGFPLQAQKYSSTSKKAIKQYEQGLSLFRVRKFDEGVESLLKAVRTDPNFIEAHYRLGTTYDLFREKDEAAKYFRRVVELAPDQPRYQGVMKVVAQYDLSQGNYAEAKKMAEQCLKLNPKNIKNAVPAQEVIQTCEYAMEGMKKPLDFKPETIPAPINAFEAQYFPVLSGDQELLIFTARKEDGTDDLFISRKENGQWQEPQGLSKTINTRDNEGTCSISADGKVLVFTYCANLRLRESFGECDLYISYKKGDDWSEPENLGPNVNSKSWDTQPSLSSDGNTLYFISNRPGGVGGKDIWQSYRGEDGKWQKAQNMGRGINTSRDEAMPFIHANNRYLYFGSNGYMDQSYGGYDLYQSERINQKWTDPSNLGYPVNDHADQVGLFITTDGKKGYYTFSEKNDETRRYRSLLKRFDIPDEIQPKVKSNYVKGYVYDTKTQARLSAEIDLFDLTQDEKQASVNSDEKTGEYLIVLNQGSEYALELSKKGYAFKSLTFNYSEGKDVEPLEFNIGLEPIRKGTVFRLNNIFFDYNRFELEDKSLSELEELVKFMQENPEVKGEISGHTDNIGDAAANMTLSLNRAKSVYDYLVENGIPAERLSYKGYGASRPDASNDSEEGRARNRRIEFEIK